VRTPSTTTAKRARSTASLTVVPDPAPVEIVEIVEGVEEDLTAEIEAEVAASLAQEISKAESLVAELDRDLHGDRWRSPDERSDDELVLASRAGDDEC
jgi:hypothetical protein